MCVFIFLLFSNGLIAVLGAEFPDSFAGIPVGEHHLGLQTQLLTANASSISSYFQCTSQARSHSLSDWLTLFMRLSKLEAPCEVSIPSGLIRAFAAATASLRPLSLTSLSILSPWQENAFQCFQLCGSPSPNLPASPRGSQTACLLHPRPCAKSKPEAAAQTSDTKTLPRAEVVPGSRTSTERSLLQVTTDVRSLSARESSHSAKKWPTKGYLYSHTAARCKAKLLVGTLVSSGKGGTMGKAMMPWK